MRFHSTNKKSEIVSFKEAVLNSLPDDKGLYFPNEIPYLRNEFFDTLQSKNVQHVAFEVLSPFCDQDIPSEKLREIIDDTFVFNIPLVELESGISCLELFHGPTMAFKDVGARFLARTLSYFKESESEETTILVATSGDTGGAVASGFYNQPGINVVILYPSGKVTPLQEKQMTTLGGNIKALEVEGDFDDCQAMVKEAFLDKDLNSQNLSSANSINIARWLPQSVYYYIPFMELGLIDNLVFSVPSGNFGNATSGILAKKMGLPIKRFIASTNLNDVVPRYLENGEYEPRDTIQTISNAMDVSKPSNFSRLQALHENSFQSILKEITGFVMNDDEIRKVIYQCDKKYGYVLDPHSAIAYSGLETGLKVGEQGVFVGTAHYCKFLDVVNDSLGKAVSLPTETKFLLEKKKESTKISSQYQDLKDFLLA